MNTPLGSGSPLGNGDYVSRNGGGLNTYFSYFIEVPSGTGNLTVDIFDADIGNTNDTIVTGPFNTAVRYTLLNPAGGLVATLNCAAGGCAAQDNVWYTPPGFTIANPANGHWEFRMDMSAAITAGDDVNTFAVRARDTSAGGFELNMYAQSFSEPGVVGAGNTATDQFYPFVTSGCTFYSNDFDSDNNATIAFTSRTGAFTQTIAAGSVSGNNAWARNTLTGWTTDLRAADYGLWRTNFAITGPGGSGGNLATFYIGNYNSAVPPPTAQPQANTFRQYLPTLAVGAPVKPYVTQTLSWESGPNPPVASSTTRVQVDVNVVNPTPWPITFSATNLVTANVPGGGVVYVGSTTTAVSQGAIIAQPAAGGTGNITWNPGTVAAGATAKMTYRLNVTPPGAARVPVTATPASGNGTRAVYIDETGNATQAIATYTFGPLCELAVTAGTALPTVAVISSFRAYEENGSTFVEWSTSSEADTAGFFLYRLDESKENYKQINRDILPGLITSPQGGTYTLIDKAASLEKSNTYLLVEIEGKGTRHSHGPFTISTEINGFSGKAAGANAQISTTEGPLSAYSRKAHAITAEKKERISNKKVTLEKTAVLSQAKTGTMVKITIEKNGLYYIDSPMISSLLGISLNTAKSLITEGGLALSSRGLDVAYVPAHDGSGIFFYGQEINSIYTNKNIYWLYKGKGLQMEHVEGNKPLSASGNEMFSENKHFEENHFAATAAASDPESDYWLWDYVIGGDPSLGSKSFTLHTDKVADLSAQAEMTVKLQGFTDTDANPDHHVRISLNSSILGEDLWNGTGQHTVVLNFSQTLLHEGDNTVTVEGLLDTGAPYSIFYINSFDLAYKRLYAAVGDSLFFRGDGNGTVTVSGFTSPDIFVFDLSNPYRPALNAAQTVSGTAGNYSVSVRPASSGTPYFAVTSSAVLAAGKVSANNLSTLSSKKNRADYIIITTQELAEAARAFAAYKQSQGLVAMVVLIDDIMNEFNYGLSSPDAVRDFLRYAYANWGKPPRYVLLAGEGSYDYKNNLGYGDNLVPVKMVSTPLGLFPSDNFFVDVNGDHIPDMAIGRLSVVTPEELNNMLSKIVSYDPKRTNKILWLADNPDDGGNFPADSDELAALIPPKYTVEKIYLSALPLSTARQRLLDGVNGGAAFLNYAGHGAVDRFAGEGLLVTSDVNSLINGNKLPVVTAMTCVTGQFGLPGYDSLSETLVTSQNGGAIAFLGPTGMAMHLDSKEFGRMFYETVFKEGAGILGDAVRRTFEKYRTKYGNSYLLDIYNLQGDPALRIK
ncbi:MAG: C25 family cysteine peptidase [Thermodesulfovibrionales bacterium]